MTELEMEFTTKVLERLDLGIRTAISKYMLHGVRHEALEPILDDMAQSIVLRLRAHVWSDPERDYRKTHEVTYTQAHPTWKHHLVASLPEKSWWRGFLHYFWDIPTDYANKRITEKIEVHVPSIFPENTYHYPEHLGRVHHPISITPLGRIEETFTPPRRELAPRLDEGAPLNG